MKARRVDFCSLNDLLYLDISRNLLFHADPQVRVCAFSLFAETELSDKFHSQETLILLEQALQYYHAETNVKARQDLIAVMRSAWTKVVNAVKVLDHKFSSQEFELPGVNQLRQAPEYLAETKAYHSHISFVNWYVRFLLNELRPTASYQRHITSLKMLDFVCSRLGCRSLRLDSSTAWLNALLSQQTLVSLFNLVMDPFDDVRQSSASLLESLCGQGISLSTLHSTVATPSSSSFANLALEGVKSPSMYDGVLLQMLKRSRVRMQGSARADHADGFGRLYGLLYGSGDATNQINCLISDIYEGIEMANSSMGLAITSAPLHGYFIAIRYFHLAADHIKRVLIEIVRYLLTRWRNSVLSEESSAVGSCTCYELWQQIWDICNRVWNVVKNTLCSDAPEGLELEESESGMLAGSKEALSFCWRALKESRYVLLRTICRYHPCKYRLKLVYLNGVSSLVTGH